MRHAVRVAARCYRLASTSKEGPRPPSSITRAMQASVRTPLPTAPIPELLVAFAPLGGSGTGGFWSAVSAQRN